MKNSRLIIFASLVLVGILITQLNQIPNLNKQLLQAKATLKQVKTNQKQSKTIISSPQAQQDNVSGSTKKLLRL
ncbi:hypothetical protein [Leuconostoc fallax]|uniref:hypothetical protein n=1 Tax=Leuconostoc fallax TaxID=1251 RepID=UPI0002F0F12D|nr:hypothetical protein [Leuconostoc fallax]